MSGTKWLRIICGLVLLYLGGSLALMNFGVIDNAWPISADNYGVYLFDGLITLFLLGTGIFFLEPNYGDHFGKKDKFRTIIGGVLTLGLLVFSLPSWYSSEGWFTKLPSEVFIIPVAHIVVGLFLTFFHPKRVMMSR